MKYKSVHPNYKVINVKMTDRTEFNIRSTGQNIKLEVDVLSHHAWTKNSTKINKKDRKIIEFNKRFQGLHSIFKQKL